MMNSKIRALLWEEFRTGGVVTVACAVAATLSMVYVWFETADTSWSYQEPAAMGLSLGAPLLLSLLLLFRRNNEGGLSGGYSRRLLLLPVETRYLVACSLFSRTLFVSVLSLFMIGLCHALYGHGPSWVLAFLLPALYVFIQGLDWLYRPAPWLTWCVAIVTPILVTIEFMVSEIGLGDMDEVTLSVSSGAFTLIVALAVVFAVSCRSVGWTRKGAILNTKNGISLPAALPLPGWSERITHHSPRWAYLWHFLRKDGGYLPTIAIVLGCLLTGGVFAAHSMAKAIDDEFLLAFFSWFIWPLFILLTGLWAMLRGGGALQRGIRTPLTDYLYPLRTADMVTTRLLGQGLVLAITWIFFLAISTAILLFAEDGLTWRIYTDAWQAGELSLREISNLQLLVPLLALLVAWWAMALRTRLMACFFGALVILWSLLGLCDVATYSIEAPDDFAMTLVLLWVASLLILGYSIWILRKQSKWLIRIAAFVTIILSALALTATDHSFEQVVTWALLLLLVTTASASVGWAWWRGIMPTKHVVVALTSGALVTLFSYPFGHWIYSGIDPDGLLFALAAGALAVFPYPALLLDLHRQRHDEDSTVRTESPDAPTSWKLSPAQRVLTVGLASALGVWALWYSWPAEPAYREVLRRQEQPATLAELAASYQPGPLEIDAAPHYLALMKEQSTREKDWARIAKDNMRNTTPEIAYAYSKYNRIAFGEVTVNPRHPVMLHDWNVAQQRYATVEAPISKALAKLTHTPFKQCRFTIDFGAEFQPGMHHLGALRKLAEVQAYSIWVAAMEDRSEDIVENLRTLGPLADTLRDEPLLVSQAERMALLQRAAEATEQALNRTPFSETQLAEIQSLFTNYLPDEDPNSSTKTGMVGERVRQTSFENLIRRTDSFPLKVFTRHLLTFARPTQLRLIEEAQPSASTPYYSDSTLRDDIEASHNLLYQLPLGFALRYKDTYEAEWRARAQNALVATACAVERFRLAEGTLPPKLENLVPQYLNEVPVDPFRPDRGPLSFRVEADEAYVIYSWSKDRQDDGGAEHRVYGLGEDAEEVRVRNWREGDLTFSVAPLAFRNGPQVTDTPVVTAMPPEQSPDMPRNQRRRGSKQR